MDRAGSKGTWYLVWEQLCDIGYWLVAVALQMGSIEVVLYVLELGIVRAALLNTRLKGIFPTATK